MTTETERRTFALFPSVIRLSTIPDAARLNARLLEAIYEIQRTVPNSLPASWSCRVYTTIASPLELVAREDFRELTQHITVECERLADDLRFDRRGRKPRVHECWVNVYGPNDAQEVHCHANSVISGVYYVKAPPGSAPITFHAPTADMMLNPPSTELNELNTQSASIPAVEGQMVLFRSWLRHSVKPSTISEDRVSVAFNAVV